MNHRGVIVLLASLALTALTARLGWWQLDRAAQKNALQAAIDERRALPPLPASALARDPSQARSQLHRRIVLEGQWRASSTVYLENRQMGGWPGLLVVTPLQLEDGSAVAVQRGWLPRHASERTRIAPYETAAGRVQVGGLIALSPGRLYEFDAAASGPIRQNLDLDAYARETGLALRPLSLLQDDPAGATEGLLRRWHRPTADVQKNYGYAFQWFALSALTCGLYVWFQLIRPRRRR